MIKSNFKKFEKDNDLKLILGDSLKVCSRLNEKFDVVYIDPPYFSGVYEKSLDVVKNICSGIVIFRTCYWCWYRQFEIIKQKNMGINLLLFTSDKIILLYFLDIIELTYK